MKANFLRKCILAVAFSLSSGGLASAKDQNVDSIIGEVVGFVKTNDYLSLISILGTEYLQSDTNRIRFEVNHLYYLYSKYIDGNSEYLEWYSDGKVDDLGRVKFSIPFYEGFDSATGIQQAILNIYLGSAGIIPMDKLSGIEVESKVDVAYRGKLLEEGKLLDIEELLEDLDK